MSGPVNSARQRVRPIGGKLTLAALATLALFCAVRLLSKDPLRNFAPYSSAIYAEDGTLMRLTTARDEQYRLWTSIDDISPRLIEAVLRYEDRWFFWHPGFNPLSLARSAHATFSGERRQGGSTLTMQLARKVYEIDSRSVGGKVRQIAAALWLEARYSKRDILEAYLNFAPYGGNIEGIGAASLAYFHKRAGDLTLPEALTLAIVPQNPTARGGSKMGSAALLQARERMVALWLDQHPEDERLGAKHPVPTQSTSALPFRAPHLANQLLKTDQGEIFSSIDLRMQSTLERAIAQRIEQHGSIGIRNAAAMLVDTQTMQVKALVGSANFQDDEIDGQVNGVLARRSPGSTLKPFIYGLAFDQGVLHPMTVLKDAPTAFGPFSPENFDGRFVGPITAQDALTRSRNVPAVSVASKLTRPSLYDLMKASGVAAMESEKHYGLALALGGGEVTMEELARLYAMLANRGELRPLRYQSCNFPDGTRSDAGAGSRSSHEKCAHPALRTAAADGAPRLLSAEAAFVTLVMLKTNPRPDTGLPASPPVAWKTGTSWGFRDAWTAGIFGRYVLVVWVGNFDGSSNPAFVGISAAAPLFFMIVDALGNEGLLTQEAPHPPPAGLTRVEVCAASGDLPNTDCHQRVLTWFVPGKSPIRLSTLHRRVLINRRTGQAVCSEEVGTQWQIVEYWPSDMQRLFRDAGMPRREAPHEPDCGRDRGGEMAGELKIVSPLRAVTYTTRISHPVAISLRAEGMRGTQYWFANEAFLGQSKAGEGLAWLPPNAGRFVLRAVDEAGQSDSRDITVELVP